MAVTTLAEWSYVDYLLNFDRIKVGINSGGEWSAYYVEPCRHLDQATSMCTVHEGPEQPQICKRYNPFNCWYRRVLTTSVSEEFLSVDRTRFDVLAELIEFDDHRRLVGFPEWSELMARFGNISDPPRTVPDTPIPDPAFDGWVSVAITGKPTVPDTPPTVRGYDTAGQPCDDCSAPCCNTLNFHQGIPTNRSSLDFMHFALGFPGVELTITEADWWITVKTTCRHLTDGRCDIYGSPTRPLTCTYYDEWRCTYKHEYGEGPLPASLLRVRLDQFNSVLETIGIDERGDVVAMPELALLRAHVEASIHTRAHA